MTELEIRSVSISLNQNQLKTMLSTPEFLQCRLKKETAVFYTWKLDPPVLNADRVHKNLH